MTVVIDTSVIIDHLRGSEPAKRLLTEGFSSNQRLAGTVLAKIEVLAGVRTGEEQATEGLLSQIEWIDVDEAIDDSAGALARRWLRSHPGVEVVDYVTAATVMRLDAELWTRNVKHFPMIPGLTAPY